MSILAYATSTAEVVSGDMPLGMSTYTTAANLATYCDEGISLDPNSGFTGAMTLPFAAAAEVWADFTIYLNTGTTRPIAYLRSGSTALFRLRCPTTTQLQVDYWDGSAWQNGSTAAGSLATGKHRMAIHAKIADSGGVVEIYLNGSLLGSFSGDTLRTAATTMDSLQLQAPGTSASYFSAIMVADEDTRAITYIARRPNAAGAVGDWTGAYTAIDETGFTDSDLIQSGSAGQVSTFAKAALPSEFSSGYQVVGVGVSARAYKGGSGPTNLQLAARGGSTNGFSADKALQPIFAPQQHVFHQNPATSAAWTFSEADGAQMGVKSAA